MCYDACRNLQDYSKHLKVKAKQYIFLTVTHTNHHLKFGKNQADNLAYIGFRRRFFPVFYWCLVSGGNIFILIFEKNIVEFRAG